MSKIKLAIFLTLIAPCISKAQDEQPKTNPIKAHSISLRFIGSPTWPLGISYGQMLTDRLSIEMGVGIFSLGAGLEYYITNPRKHRFNLNTGLYGSFNYDGYPMFYIPLGVSYISKKSFQYNINAGVLNAKNVSFSENGNNVSPWFGLTIGKRFGEDVGISKNTKHTELSNIIGIRLGLIYPLIGISYERLLSPNIGLEASIGFLGVSLGSNVYFPSLKPGKIGFKTGITQGVNHNLLAGIGKSTYLPFGINYLSQDSFVFSIDGGPQYWYHDKEFLPGFSIKIGKAF
jgi:hypothetical protein